MRAISAALLVAAAVALAGCPRFTNDGLACGPNGACPSGFHCAADHRCWKMNQNPDLSAVVTERPDLAGADLLGVPSPDLYGVAPGADLAGTTAGPDMAPSLGLGQLCGGKGDCMSGNCVDGVCCDLPYTSACMSCNQSTALGKCTPVAPGNSPSHGTCGPDPMTGCGRNGKCDGAGNCANWDSTTVCKASSCTGSTLTAAGHCDGAGHCNVPSPTSCGVYTCDSANGVCWTSCSGTGFTDGHCNQAGGSGGCNTGTCGPRANGQPCSVNGDCQSTKCDTVSGVCCDSTSCGGCKSCTLGTTLGMCTNVASGDPNHFCPTNASTCTAGGCTNGACTPSPSGTVCNQSCTMTNMFAVAKCSGSATSCPALGAPVACAGDLVCADPSSCKQTCSADSDCVGQYWCNNGNCQQQGDVGVSTCTPNGGLCMATSCDQCKGNAPCTTFYHDGDNDMHGDPNAPASYCGTTPPPNYTTGSNADDCCDADGNVHPGQTAWFYSASAACGTAQNPFWNYDCSVSGVDEQYGNTVAVCTSSGSCGCTNPLTCTMTKHGWTTADPGCGNTGAYLMSCGIYGDCSPGACGGDGGGKSCNASNNVSTSKQQGCH